MRSRDEKVNEKVIYKYIQFDSFYIATRLENHAYLKSLGLRSRIYEDVVEEVSIIRMLMLFADARRETEDDENGDYQRGREKLFEWDAQRVTSI